MARRILVLIAALYVGAAIGQTTYQYTDEAGNTVFSDRPPPVVRCTLFGRQCPGVRSSASSSAPVPFRTQRARHRHVAGHGSVDQGRAIARCASGRAADAAPRPADRRPADEAARRRGDVQENVPQDEAARQRQLPAEAYPRASDERTFAASRRTSRRRGRASAGRSGRISSAARARHRARTTPPSSDRGAHCPDSHPSNSRVTDGAQTT
jgi:hypothetical protein